MVFRALTLDAQKTIKGRFKPSMLAEREFSRALRRVAQMSAHIVEQHVGGIGTPQGMAELQRRLEDYSEKLEPWAIRKAQKLLDQVEKSNKRAYAIKSKAIGTALNLGAGETYVRETSLQLMREQVALIKSLPLEAGLRAQKIATEVALSGARADTALQRYQEEIAETQDVTISRAMLIARTETARATAAINQSRAVAIGSGQYRWHNSGDEAVRHSHRFYKGRRLQGMIFAWDDPPTLDDGMTGHPGSFPNCRCFAEPIFTDE